MLLVVIMQRRLWLNVHNVKEHSSEPNLMQVMFTLWYNPGCTNGKTRRGDFTQLYSESESQIISIFFRDDQHLFLPLPLRLQQEEIVISIM